MQLESHGIATGDPDRAYVARVTCGTRKRMEVLHEWEASSQESAEQEAEDWMFEYIARLTGGDEELLHPAAIAARRGRLHAGMPPLPEPCELYRNAMSGTVDRDGRSSIADAPLPARTRKPATSTVIKRVVDGARRAGIDVAGIRVWPDGSVAAFDARWVGAGPDLDPDER